MRNRRRKNKITQIKNQDNTWISEPQAVEQHFADHFKQLFTEPHHLSVEEIQSQLINIPIPTLTPHQLFQLDQLIQDEEIIQAVNQLGPLKTLGPDGIPAAFYQTFWSTVKQDILNMVKAFFHSGFLLKSLNDTFLTLIPKITTPELVTQFRSISLCNVTYKIIAKIMVNRLKPFMDGLITPFQNAFIQGRLITDNIILAQEIFEFLKRKHKGKWGFGALKLDMNKAYDRVSWNFFTAVLKTMGFSDKWLKWISQCVTTVTYSILINGCPTQTFTPTRGLRQGDPLSPYLFLLRANIFSCALAKQEHTNKLTGLKIGGSSPPLTHLFFADDSFLFFKNNTKSLISIQSTLNWYCTLSGQTINLDKSELYCSPNMTTT